jgi:hypothetical protein
MYGHRERDRRVLPTECGISAAIRSAFIEEAAKPLSILNATACELAPAAIRRDPPRLVFAEQLGCRAPIRQPNDGFLRFKDNRRNGGLDHGQTVRFDFSNAVEHRQQLCLKPTQLRTGWPRHRRYYGPAV